MTAESFELGPIRPPSEAYSLLIRVTRNCPWNRCKFCHIYKGKKFELRSVEEIKQEISTIKAIQDKLKETSWKSGHGGRVEEVAGAVLNNPPNEAFFNVALWLYSGGTSAFLQDANSLIMRTNELAEIIRFLKQTLPSITRVTCYGRSKTAAKKKLEELIQLHQAGLSRLHIGLESGYDPVLQYMDKGVTAAEHIAGGRKIVESGISLCEYVVLGLGGKEMWREHAIETARVLNEIDADFIRVRTLTIKQGMPLYDEVKNGNFIRATDEEIVEEEKLLIEHLDCHSYFVSDHITNLLQEIEGKLPQDKEKMLASIARFQSLSPEEKHNFMVGRRVGIYDQLDDLYNLHKHSTVEHAIQKLSNDGNQVDEEIIYTLMERFI
ncbi:MAG: radical SAM protein [Dehalococcoidales bacterium]|nr:radical SAM protein [Dehalococcoidales bacterium]